MVSYMGLPIFNALN